MIERRVHVASDDAMRRKALNELSPAQRSLRPLAVVRGGTVAVVPTTRHLVSVVVPCYNYGHFLAASVRSALSQNDVDVEVIIVDDASTDASADIAEGLAAQNSRVRVVRNEVNRGHVVTFNNGYACAEGEFIVRLDADDMLTPGSLARAVSIFEAFPTVGLVYGRPRHFTTEVPPEPRTKVRGWTVWAGREWLAERCRRGVNCITTPEAIVRAAVMQDVGTLDTRLRYAQDMEIWLRVSAVSDIAHVDGPDQALHRDHANSMSATSGAGKVVDLEERRRVFEVLFDHIGLRVPESELLHSLARRSMAIEALRHACHAYDRGRTSSASVKWYMDFARNADPTAPSLAQWRALNRRMGFREGMAHFWPPFVLAAVTRRLRDELAYMRWARSGI